MPGNNADDATDVWEWDALTKRFSIQMITVAILRSEKRKH